MYLSIYSFTHHLFKEHLKYVRQFLDLKYDSETHKIFTLVLFTLFTLQYTLSGQVIMISEHIIIWLLNVCVCVYVYIRGLVHVFMHGWGPASLARGRGRGWLAGLPAV